MIETKINLFQNDIKEKRTNKAMLMTQNILFFNARVIECTNTIIYVDFV